MSLGERRLMIYPYNHNVVLYLAPQDTEQSYHQEKQTWKKGRYLS